MLAMALKQTRSTGTSSEGGLAVSRLGGAEGAGGTSSPTLLAAPAPATTAAPGSRRDVFHAEDGGPWLAIEGEACWSGAVRTTLDHSAGATIAGAAPKSAGKRRRPNKWGNPAGDCLEPPGSTPGGSAVGSAGVGLQHATSWGPSPAASWPPAGCARDTVSVSRAQCAVGAKMVEARKDQEVTERGTVEQRREVQSGPFRGGLSVCLGAAAVGMCGWAGWAVASCRNRTRRPYYGVSSRGG